MEVPVRATLFPGCALALACLPLTGAAAPKPAKRTAPKPRTPVKAPAAAGVRVISAERRVELDVFVAKRAHDDVLKGAIEYLLVAKGGKAYESVFETSVRPDALDRALKQVGLKPGAPPDAPDAEPTGPGVSLLAIWKDAAGREQQVPAEELVLDVVEGKPLSGLRWTYTGSKMTEDPATSKMVLMATQTNNLVSTHREDPTVLLMNPLPAASGKRYKRNEARLPKAGAPVRLVFMPAAG
jgi:hypothetical protein